MSEGIQAEAQKDPAECWKSIGTFGDRSCPRLTAEVHCRNCEVYRAGGRNLLDRPQPEAYRKELTRLLAEPEAMSHWRGLAGLAFVLFCSNLTDFAGDSHAGAKQCDLSGHGQRPWGDSPLCFSGAIDRC
jgi:hypothetical protein